MTASRAAACALLAVPLLAVPLLLTGCDVFGSKSNSTTDEIFEEGRTDPTLPSEVGYVPLTPFYTFGINGPLNAPVDVYVGYDEYIYVGDTNGLHILDLAGRPQALVSEVAGQPLRDITAVIQDRRLDVYVAARRDTTIEGADCPSGDNASQCDLPVIYRLRGLTDNAVSDVQVMDIIWHPFDDRSRPFRFQTPGTYEAGSVTYSDEDASFSGLAVLATNQLYATRRGPVNSFETGRPNQTVSPFNALFEYTPEGDYVQFLRTLTPDRPSLLSAYYPSDVLTFVGPPQRASIPLDPDFLIAQAPPPSQPRPTYGIVSVQVVETSDGIEYQVDGERVSAAGNPDAGEGFLFEADQFEQPSGMAYAPDVTGYIFVTDAGTDSLYVFNQGGIEGVAPPAASDATTPVKVSFGGSGSGPLQFNDPGGVAYYQRIVYVADTGNNRIARYRLNTDFE